jgi:hypothetical protein
MRNKMDDLIEKIKNLKSTMNWQTVFNPFSKFSEKQLFLIGFLFFIANCWCVFYFNKWIVFFHFSPQENLTLRGIHFR